MVNTETIVFADRMYYAMSCSQNVRDTMHEYAELLRQYRAAAEENNSRRTALERLKAATNIQPNSVDTAVAHLEIVGSISAAFYTLYISN